MMPLHPLAAAVVGGMVGVVAVLAPEPPELAHYPGHLSAANCDQRCLARDGLIVAVGDIAADSQVHMITRPGRYGLSSPPKGHAYAIVGGHIVRLDQASQRIVSVLRPVPQILD